MKLEYMVVISKTPNNCRAYAPDVPGCVSVGDTRDEMEAMIREALELRIKDMVERGCPVPEPRMSLLDAMGYHLTMPDAGDKSDDYAETELSFAMVEVEVEASRV